MKITYKMVKVSIATISFNIFYIDENILIYHSI